MSRTARQQTPQAAAPADVSEEPKYAQLAGIAGALVDAGHMVTQIVTSDAEAPEQWGYGDGQAAAVLTGQDSNHVRTAEGLAFDAEGNQIDLTGSAE